MNQMLSYLLLLLWLSRWSSFVLALSSPTASRFKSIGTVSAFYSLVTEWLDEEGLSWNQADPGLFPQTDCPVLDVVSSSSERSVRLHLLASPQSTQDCVSCTTTRAMMQQTTDSLIHLHQDVWNAQEPIVKSRLLLRLGRFQSRIFARQTQARRIPADLALPFLMEHHLWSAVKSKYYYGLYTTKDETLVAVASFGARRKVTRGGIPHKSHELIRFCTRRDGMVVGAISKLLKAFIRDQQPDDIVTVVDRDWGPGDGWHGLGFETAHVMPPLAMAVSKEDGIRRHLVGAGIVRPHENNNQPLQQRKNNGRLGIDESILKELNKCVSHQDALQALERHGLFQVYDAGVERLLMIVPKDKGQQQSLSPLELWQQSVPTYASTYYSNNAGINTLLEHARERAAEIDETTRLLQKPSD